MPVWLSFVLAVVATAGLFGGLVALVLVVVEGKKAGAKPNFNLSPGDKPGTLIAWSNWRPSVFNVRVYRIRVQFLAPDYQVKEGTFTYTFEPPVNKPFQVSLELPPVMKELIEVGARAKGAMITFDMRTVEELTIWREVNLTGLRKLYHGKGKAAPSSLQTLPAAAPDVPTTMTLDYSELVVRRKKIRDLEAAAKAKAAKAAPKPAAAAPTAPPPEGAPA